jgi:RNA-binding protein Luc7-like 2
MFISRIESLNKKINFFLEQAEVLGESGKIEESENLLKEIEKMKLQRTELSTMSENPFLQMEKQMRVCEICGAMQSMSDTEKRLTTHLEGKLHTGD